MLAYILYYDLAFLLGKMQKKNNMILNYPAAQ